MGWEKHKTETSFDLKLPVSKLTESILLYVINDKESLKVFVYENGDL